MTEELTAHKIQITALQAAVVQLKEENARLRENAVGAVVEAQRRLALIQAELEGAVAEVEYELEELEDAVTRK